MFYREAGQFKTSYASDQAIFPIVQDRVFVVLIVLAAYIVPPAFLGSYWFNAVLIPFLIFSMAALGLNLLVGYCGQLSLGTGGFMAVGAYASYKFTTSFPDLGMIFVFLLSGFVAAAVGVVFGLPSLRIKGFYLAVATLAAQFFLQWLFNKVPWFYNYNSNGTIESPPRTLFGTVMEPGGLLEVFEFPQSAGDQPARDAVDQVSVRADAGDRVRADRQEPGARPRRPRLDGDPRHGHRRRADRHPPDADQAVWPSPSARSIAASPVRCC